MHADSHTVLQELHTALALTTMKKILPMTLIVASACGAAGFFWASQHETTEFSGFTVTVVDEMINSKRGKNPTANGYILALRPNGDESITETIGGITNFRIVKTKTKHYWFDSESKTISTFYQQLSPPPAAPPVDPTCETHTDIEGAELIGHGTFYGLPVVKWRQKSNSRNGDLDVVETWEAPSLGCRAIYTDFIHSSSDGAVLAETRRMLTDLRFGEPDPSLFDPPAGSREVKPSELQKMFESVRGLPPQYAPSLNEKRDNKYFASQQYK